jgi:hypothetical protein
VDFHIGKRYGYRSRSFMLIKVAADRITDMLPAGRFLAAALKIGGERAKLFRYTGRCSAWNV